MTTRLLKFKSLIVGVSLFIVPAYLTACSKPAEAPVEEAVMEAAPEITTDGQTSEARLDTPSLPQLAYDYSFSLSAPDKALDSLLSAHRNACTAAGAAICQVISMDSTSDRAQHFQSHRLILRATPQWIESFRNDLNKQLAATDGRIEAQTIATEDLTAQMVDHEARINNQIALRDNLQTTLRTHRGKMSDVIELQNQLNDVQSQIDYARSQLALMKKRVAMSKVTLTYSGAAAAQSQGTLSPLLSAFGSVGPNFIAVMTFMVMIFSYVLPFAVVLAPIVWIVTRRRKKPAKVPGA
ncbi:DUF4349 domain-containing protein [Asticcacaulis sp. SL142]|uniref:DUF4349 domain-containing protein n=1 Tax=Asticcacaulis sp. SL142 TaxID=2995155 RepID=UPI00226D320A|nr:DUF4349 domain-containing protein [Asticcacaulis sp. SL142]WAC48139.1 DUF4349 domain-containing protein [Asticcacaulis sp. SL142]